MKIQGISNYNYNYAKSPKNNVSNKKANNVSFGSFENSTVEMEFKRNCGRYPEYYSWAVSKVGGFKVYKSPEDDTFHVKIDDDYFDKNPSAESRRYVYETLIESYCKYIEKHTLHSFDKFDREIGDVEIIASGSGSINNGQNKSMLYDPNSANKKPYRCTHISFERVAEMCRLAFGFEETLAQRKLTKHYEQKLNEKIAFDNPPERKPWDPYDFDTYFN